MKKEPQKATKVSQRKMQPPTGQVSLVELLHSGNPVAAQLLRLQRTIGNRAVQQLLGHNVVRSKWNKDWENRLQTIRDGMHQAVEAAMQFKLASTERQQKMSSCKQTISGRLEVFPVRRAGSVCLKLQGSQQDQRAPIDRQIEGNYEKAKSRAVQSFMQLKQAASEQNISIIAQETPILYGATPKSQVLSHLQSLKNSINHDSSVYRKEISEFQRDNSVDQIAVQQQRILESLKSVSVDQINDSSRVMRKCGGGESDSLKRKKKRAGVESFVVEWSKNTLPGRTKANLRLDYTARFRKDDEHDPALAEFRQNAADEWEVTEGPWAGSSNSTPMHDDKYSRADDRSGNSKSDVDFYSNDYPGWPDERMDDDNVLDYTFTAEQLIIDTSRGNKAIAQRGPHTATIKGKHPRIFGGVPKTLS